MEGGAVRAEPFLDLSGEISPTVDIAQNERGLFSIAFAPDYATSRLFYVFFSDANGDSRVVRFRATPDGRAADPASRRTIVYVPHSFSGRHYGGQLAFGSDGRLYASLGEAQRPKWAQTRRLYGSIVSLDPRRPRRSLRQVARGLRNPYRFTFERGGGMVVTDVGESDFEEIDVLPRRRRGVANFGWPWYEGPKRHRRKRIAHYVRPRLWYSHRVGTAIVGGPVMRDGRFLYGDFCDGWIATARLYRRRPTTSRTGLVLPAITAFGEDAAHRLYVASAYGQLYRFDPV